MTAAGSNLGPAAKSEIHLARLPKTNNRSSNASGSLTRRNYERPSRNYFKHWSPGYFTPAPDKTFTRALLRGNTSSRTRSFNETMSEKTAAHYSEYENDSHYRVSISISAFICQRVGGAA